MNNDFAHFMSTAQAEYIKTKFGITDPKARDRKIADLMEEPDAPAMESSRLHRALAKTPLGMQALARMQQEARR